MNVSQLMPSPDRENHDKYIARFRQSRQARIIGIGREVHAQRRDGTCFPVHLAVSEFQYQGETFFAGILRDISDVVAARSELCRLNQHLQALVHERTMELEKAHQNLARHEQLAMLGQVSGGIAHEIRNPLNAIKTSVYYLLNTRSASADKIDEHLQRIDRQVSLIDQTISALVDMARLPEPRFQTIDLNVLLADLLRAFDFGKTKVSFVPGHSPAEAIADGTQIPIVFRNLFRNACEAMAENGIILLRVRSHLHELQVEIEDQGNGISPEIAPHVMEPMFSTKPGGVGLGLAISKTILERNRGRLTFTSQPGIGSIFSVWLPRYQAPVKTC